MSVLETNAGDRSELLAAGPEGPHERPAALARLKAPLSDPKDIYLPIRGAIRLENGGMLRDPHIRVRRFGRRNAPPVLVMGGASNGRKLSGPDGWWSDLVAAGAAVDLTQHCALGLDFAPLGDERVALSPTIQARLIAHALDELGLDKLHALIGASYGGMVGLAFAALAPERLDALCVISAAHRPAPLAMAWRGVARRIVEFGLQNDLGPEALALARQLAMVTYCSPREFSERFHCIMGGDGRTDLDRYLVSRGEPHGDAMSPRRWLSLSEAIDRCSVAPEAVKVPTTLVACPSDQIVPMEDVAKLARRLPQFVALHALPSIHGHDAFLKEHERLGGIVRSFLRGAAQ